MDLADGFTWRYSQVGSFCNFSGCCLGVGLPIVIVIVFFCYPFWFYLHESWLYPSNYIIIGYFRKSSDDEINNV